MKHVKLLDCTLRDGAYLVDKTFGKEVIKGIINGLVQAKIDFIEIGFFQNDGFGEGKTVFRNSEHAKEYVPFNKGDSLFTVLADYSRFDVNNLDERQDASIDAIRECFFKHERMDALKACLTIKEKGYKLFVQPVDILGYSDIELIQLVEEVNKIEPYCISIVDTFGSMYQEDLHRVFEILDHNLISSCKIGFHSHNNMQLSNALSQEIVRLSAGRREIIIDGTLNGMGRGAGNTPTELIVQYLNSHQGYTYDLDSLLDLIDDYMNGIRSRCSWGYNTPYFVAGCYGAHVNNIAYLSKKNSVRSKNIRLVLDRIGAANRKRYNYELLEKEYQMVTNGTFDDTNTISKLRGIAGEKSFLILLPGPSVKMELDTIKGYIDKNNPIVISVNYIDSSIKADYAFFSNIHRYRYWSNSVKYEEINKIIISSIKDKADDDSEFIISYNKLIQTESYKIENALIMLLRFLDSFVDTDVAIAGFDGYGSDNNYLSQEMELSSVSENPNLVNQEINDALVEYMSRREKNNRIYTITKSRFSDCFDLNN